MSPYDDPPAPPPPAARGAARATAALATGSALVADGVLGLALAAVARDGWASLRGPAPVAPADVLVAVVAGAGSVLCLWVGVSFVLALAAALPGVAGVVARRVAERVAPLVVRRTAAAVLGGLLVATGSAPALAATGGPGSRAPATATRSVAPSDPAPAPQTWSPAWVAAGVSAISPGSWSGDGLSPDLRPGVTQALPGAGPAVPPGAAPPATAATPTPGASPTTTPASAGARQLTPGPEAGRRAQARAAGAGLGVLGPRAARGDAATARGARAVTVVAGDTLWGIAAGTLDPGADPGSVGREWPRWFAANAGVIGPDPDLIRPGQVLHAPTTTPTGTAADTGPTAPADPGRGGRP